MAGLETTPEMFDLRMSEAARPLFDAVKKFIEEEGIGLCELMLDHEQDQCPKAINRRRPDGTTEPTVFEDMYPFLDKKEVEANMLPPLPKD